MSANTKLKILRTAAREFAEHGFRKTTIRTICQKAAVNVAAVNYHFAGKAELYCRTIDWLMEAVCVESKAFSEGNSPTQNIRLWVDDCIRERAAGKSWQRDLVLRIVHHEMQGPSENYDCIYQTRIAPDLEILSESIKRGMNGQISEKDLKLKVFSLLGHTLFYVFHQNMINKYAGNDYLDKHQDKIIDTIVADATNNFVIDEN
jgi:TetR/AcrR family transcriptional regulator, regulator of cefoperazone and chloramphenicol sensitivity